MWEPRRLSNLWASTVCYRDSFVVFFFVVWRSTGSEYVLTKKDMFDTPEWSGVDRPTPELGRGTWNTNWGTKACDIWSTHNTRTEGWEHSAAYRRKGRHLFQQQCWTAVLARELILMTFIWRCPVRISAGHCMPRLRRWQAFLSKELTFLKWLCLPISVGVETHHRTSRFFPPLRPNRQFHVK
jgi:hypothetical protein